VPDERQDGVERVAQDHGPEGSREHADGATKKTTYSMRRGSYSPSPRSGVRSRGSVSSISFVKMRSERA
jgi:hypothetical protein